MKKLLAILLAAAMVLALAACGGSSGPDTTKGEGVLTHAEYLAADLDSEVTIEAYIQGAQAYSAEYGNTTLYLQDADGGYFVYRIACSESDAKKLTAGTKVKITGYKSEWSGEVEIIDATFEIEKGSYTAAAQDVTSLLGTAELESHQNEFVAMKGLTVEASEGGAAYLYNWDGSGSQGDDLYFNVSDGKNTYTFTVESDLCDSASAVYKAVEALNVGDTIDLEGFLYWYEGPQPHVTSVTVK